MSRPLPQPTDRAAATNPGDAGATEFPDLSRLLAPQSIAIVGASDQPGNLGGVAIGFLRKFGYPGAIWPVNPRRSEVHGIKCVARLADLPRPADLAILATGAETAPGLVRECAAAGIRFAVIWAGGFAEVGGRGVALQEELAAACRETGVAIVGPNCIGVINSWQPATASFASFLLETDRLIPGVVSMVSQSGGLATSAQALAQQAGFGFRYTISSGNEAVLTLADHIHALARDADTRVIAVYLEGVRDGERFLAALGAARDAGKPVVVLKGGETAAGARAAAAHTGALAGEGRVWDAVLREHAAIRVDSLEALLDVVLFLSSAGPGGLPAGTGVAAVTTGGGGGVLTADQCVRHGLVTPPFAAATRAALAPLVPPIASIGNPVDFTPQVFNQEEWCAHFGPALDAIAADPGIHAVLVQFGAMGRRGLEMAQAVADFRRRAAKTVCIAWQLAPPGAVELLRGDGAHVFAESPRAVAVLGKLARHRAEAAEPRRRPIAPMVFDWAAQFGHPAAGAVIGEHDCHRLLAAAGLTVAPGRLARSADEAEAAARAVGMPVAMKGISPQVTHRAAAGLVALDIAAAEAARGAYDRLSAIASAAGVALDGILVQRMIRGGHDILVSAFRDAVLGAMVSVGAGGNLTELIDDVAIARAPIDDDAAVRLLRRLRSVRALERSRAPPPIAKLAAFVAQLSQLAAGAPWRRFVLEINPVKWTAESAVAADGLLIVEEP